LTLLSDQFRSPEEYRYEIQTEKVDIYSMGNIFYVLLTNKKPFENVETKETQMKVAHGELPFISPEQKQSKDPSDIALMKAIEMCWRFVPQGRSSAREVAIFLDEAIETIMASQ